ncbi:MAG TPA: (Fe-S)-binding protein [Nitrospirota bacterium]|nr:(Fe-S)-binding protein [Nitrospirota bacterium]
MEKSDKLAKIQPGMNSELEKIYYQTDTCVRCGRCTAVCPTYKTTRKETMSARGRIFLARKYMEGSLELSKTFALYNDLCLGCQACLEVCPPKIETDKLISLIKQDIIDKQGISLDSKMMLKICSHPQAFHWIAKLLDFNKKSGIMHLLPYELQNRANMFPSAATKTLKEILDTQPVKTGGGKLKVGYYPGCLTNALYPELGLSVIKVLQQHGCDVVVPNEIVCCGLPHKAGGEHEEYTRLARKNIEFFAGQDVDYIVTNCGTCTRAFKDYIDIFEKDTHMAVKARQFVEKSHDIMGFLSDIAGLKVGSKSLGGIRLTYHESCHLNRGLRVSKQPRKLLESLPGATFIEMPRANWCCGGAGSFSFKHPDTARKILLQKIGDLQSTGAEVITAGCLGCILQLGYGAREFEVRCTVKHPIELLAMTY